jgi:hypothetical protein
MTRQFHSSRFDHPNIIWWEQIIKFFIMHSFSLPYYLVPLKSNILLSTLFSNTISLSSSLNVGDQVSHPYKTRAKIMFIYLNLYNFPSEQEAERFSTAWKQPFPEFNLLLISSWMGFLIC